MKQADAEAAYNREWPAYNRRLQAAQGTCNPKAIKRARQALSALSVEYEDRHRVEPTFPHQPTQLEQMAEQIQDLQERVNTLEGRDVT